MTLILRGAYTHRVYDDDKSHGAVTDCGMPISFFDRLRNVDGREAAKLVDCPGCLRARTGKIEALL